MLNTIRLWIQERYLKIINSIAFWPALIGLLFLVVSWLIIEFDYSESGKHLKSRFDYLTLKDASTARTIISAVAAGIISLTVFSFSMVMIVLNQAASQMSNRVLDKLIGNRFQQVVLGIYIGTIVYALFLLTTIRDIDSGIYIPAISTYILILLTILDIFLFIYFLHYITQSVKYKVIIERIYHDTKDSLKHTCKLQKRPPENIPLDTEYVQHLLEPGIYEGFNTKNLISICKDNDCRIELLQKPGTFLLAGQPIFRTDKKIDDEVADKIIAALYIDYSESIERNFYYGFRQLMEVAIKALSPGVNDPGTAMESLRALFRLYAYRVCFFPATAVYDDNSQLRVMMPELHFDQIFADTLLPIWDYGKNDRMIQHEMYNLLTQFHTTFSNELAARILVEVKAQLNSHTLK